MLDNIEKVLARGERIEDTVARTDEMANNALHFKKAGTSLKRYMWLKNIKLWLILGGVLILLAYIIAAIACKSPIFKGCWKKKTPAPSPPGAPHAPAFQSDASNSAPALAFIVLSMLASMLL